MTRNEYNGWYNYETWNYFSWMSNDQRAHQNAITVARMLHIGETVTLYDPKRERSQDFSILGDDKSDYYTSTHALSEYLSERAWIEMERELIGDIGDPTWVRSAVIGAIQECNFFEIADHIIHDNVTFDDEMDAYAEDIDQQAHAQGRESSVD